MTAIHASRLQALRDELLKLGYDGFLVPMADEYQSEYVPASARRIEFLCGFTGSAGFIAVLKDKAAFFTDGRYTLQAQQQIAGDLFRVFDSAIDAPTDWLAKNLPQGAKLAYDPWLHTEESVTRLKKAVTKAGAELVPVVSNPVDAIWADRPAPPAAPAQPYDIAHAGKSSSDKRAEIAAALKKDGAGAAVIADPASIAWLLNVRGGDVPHTPLPLSFAIIRDTGAVSWFLDPKKRTKELAAHIGGSVEMKAPDEFLPALAALGQDGKPVRIDPSEAASAIVDALREANVPLDPGEDPCVLPKACKNPVELEGMRAAHRRDGAALVRFLAWLELATTAGDVTELGAEERLEAFRATSNLYRGPSFETIAGVGAHGAVVHYRATRTTNRKLELGQSFLLDSGGQYVDGTTDVTRTLSIGTPLAEIRDPFTRVLKGHIALAAVRFPEGTSGAELDILARQYLWAAGLDYSHGTGHGVGSYLGVHEGPQGISKRSKVALCPGMVVSNEPGYYKAGAYGIRIENLQTVIEVGSLVGEKKMLGFETLTLVPIDRRLIEIEMLSMDERAWLNAYHARVNESLRALLDAPSAAWLADATRPI